MRSTEKIRVLIALSGALAGAVVLAACGGGGGVGGADTSDITVAKGGPASGSVLISNWPGYVDPGADGTIAQFQQQTGIKTTYKEDVNDNNTFFNKL